MISVHAPASHYQSPTARFGLRLFAIILMMTAIAASIALAVSVADARASVAWPTVSGIVVRSAVKESANPTSKRYEASIEYSYVAEGRGRSGQSVSFGRSSSRGRTNAEGIVAEYPAGATVTVHYKPSDPDTALLETGIRPTQFWRLLIPLGMLVVAIAIWQATKQQPTPADAG